MPFATLVKSWNGSADNVQSPVMDCGPFDV